MCAHPVSFNENVITLRSINGCRLWLDVHSVFPFYPEIIQILSNLAVVLIQRGISLQDKCHYCKFYYFSEKEKTRNKAPLYF